MTDTMFIQFDKGKGTSPTLPKTENVPISPSEMLVREEINKLTENSEEIKKLKEQVKKKTIQSSDK